MEGAEGVNLNANNERNDAEHANNAVFPRPMDDVSSDSEEAASHISSESDDSRYQKFTIFVEKNVIYILGIGMKTTKKIIFLMRRK